jgi:Na+/H+ antiporter NhaD/arsenite permease-like protein
VLFPFHVPLYVPRRISNAWLDCLAAIRVTSPRPRQGHGGSRKVCQDDNNGKIKPYVRFNFPVNFITAPLIADLFLLAILAIHRDEVYAGTIGDNNIYPYEIMLFFITLAYIAISIDASGLIRYLAFRVLKWGGEVGHRLFLYLYVFFFGIASFIGNDPVILSGTAFLAYMTRVSSNITHPRAWIHTQFAVANIASAILVSSNPTNLVLAGAFNVKFIDYTANMIVPVIITGIVLFPFLLYVVFANEELIPLKIEMHELDAEARARPAVNPNIPNARGAAAEEENRRANGEEGKLLSLEEIMNPFLDKGGATFGAITMAITLITVLVINAVSNIIGRVPVYYITLPAAVVMLCWDLSYGWLHRHETREIARKGREEVELLIQQRALEEETLREVSEHESGANSASTRTEMANGHTTSTMPDAVANVSGGRPMPAGTLVGSDAGLPSTTGQQDSRMTAMSAEARLGSNDLKPAALVSSSKERATQDGQHEEKHATSGRLPSSAKPQAQERRERPTLVSACRETYRWSQETFPTVTAVLAHLPFALIPFAFTMFVLVQALVSTGWVPVFAWGWEHWVNKTGTLGAIGGMAFLSVILCNVCNPTSPLPMPCYQFAHV